LFRLRQSAPLGDNSGAEGGVHDVFFLIADRSR
jgi:hypothetical protein